MKQLLWVALLPSLCAPASLAEKPVNYNDLSATRQANIDNKVLGQESAFRAKIPNGARLVNGKRGTDRIYATSISVNTLRNQFTPDITSVDAFLQNYTYALVPPESSTMPDEVIDTEVFSPEDDPFDPTKASTILDLQVDIDNPPPNNQAVDVDIVYWKKRSPVSLVNPYFALQGAQNTYGISFETGTDSRRFHGPGADIPNQNNHAKPKPKNGDPASTAPNRQGGAANPTAKAQERQDADTAVGKEYSQRLWHFNTGLLRVEDGGHTLADAAYAVAAQEFYKTPFRLRDGSIPTTYDALSLTGGFFHANNAFTQEYVGIIERHAFNSVVIGEVEFDGAEAEPKDGESRLGLISRASLRRDFNGGGGDAILVSYLPKNFLAGGAGGITYQRPFGGDRDNSFRLSYTTNNTFLFSLLLQTSKTPKD